MHVESAAAARPASHRIVACHVLMLVVLCLGIEALFLHHGLGWFDEAWPLYAAQRLRDGGSLYRDIFFLFPPGHLAPAWLAQTLAPPGIVLARAFYSAFDLALVLSLYALGRRLMPAHFALLGAALVAVAAPESQLAHLLFGYRYLVFSVLALLAFAKRLESGDRRWMFVSGVAAGIGLVFRTSPPFAACFGIGLAAVAASRDRAEWIRDAAAMVAGLLLVTLPLWIWIGAGPGFETVWRELVVRLAGLQAAQALPAPPLAWPPEWSREQVSQLFVALQMRAYPLLLLCYLAFAARSWQRGGRGPLVAGEALLLAVTAFAAVYLIRAVGRSDDHHLYSALPPICVILAHAAWKGLERVHRDPSPRVAAGVILVIFCAWGFLMRVDTFLAAEARGQHALRSIPDTVYVDTLGRARSIDRRVNTIRRWSGPNDAIFSMSLTPIFYVLTERRGPGGFDIVMPGTFLDDEEEAGFVDRLQAQPPAVVVFPIDAFDAEESRSVAATAPQVTAWIRENYAPIEPVPSTGFVLMAPRGAMPRTPSAQ